MRHLSLAKKIMIVIIAIFIIFIGNAVIDLANEYQKNQETLEVLESNLRKNYDQSIKMQMETLFDLIDTLRIQYEAQNLSEEEVKIRIANTIREIRYGMDGYFWADTITGDNIVLYGSEVEGTNRYDLQDENGKYIIREIIENALAGGGYTDYMFPKQGEQNAQPKRAYSNYYEPFQWVIGTGIYTDDIDTEISRIKAKQGKELQQNFIIHLVILSCFFILLVTGVFIFVKKFVEMLRFSTSYSRAIADNDFTIAIPEPYLKRKDELGILIRSLVEMKSELQTTFQEKEYTAYQLGKEKEFLDTILESISDGIVVLSAQGRIQMLNASAAHILGRPENEILGLTFEKVFSFKDKDNQEIPADEILLQCKINGKEAKRECYLSNHKPRLYLEDSIAPLIDEQGRSNGYVYVFRDISEREKKQKEIEYLSYHDLLTGLYNRRFFEMKCRELFEKGIFPIGIVIADLNALKLTNDAFGHIMGDRLIRAFANTLKNASKSGHLVCRIGGDEFIVLLPGQGLVDAKKMVSSLKIILNKTYVGNIPLSAAFGCSVCDNGQVLFEEAFRQADEAMYKNKLKENETIKTAMIDSILENNKSAFWNNREEMEQVIYTCHLMGEQWGLNPIECNRLLKAAAIHNIGYSTLDQSVVRKEDELNSKEWHEIRKHPMAGYHMLKNLGTFSDIADLVLEHHENVDGTGYPRGLKREQIQKETLVLSVVSSYYSMTHDRPYRKAMSSKQAMEQLKKDAGVKYERELVMLLIKIVGSN